METTTVSRLNGREPSVQKHKEMWSTSLKLQRRNTTLKRYRHKTHYIHKQQRQDPLQSTIKEMRETSQTTEERKVPHFKTKAPRNPPVSKYLEDATTTVPKPKETRLAVASASRGDNPRSSPSSDLKQIAQTLTDSPSAPTSHHRNFISIPASLYQ